MAKYGGKLKELRAKSREAAYKSLFSKYGENKGVTGELYHGLFDVIANLSDDLVLYPGHDYGSSSTSTIGKEKQTNPVMQKMSENEFVERMGG